jgi:hypothetical protein
MARVAVGYVRLGYGEDDPFYSIDHSRSNLAQMEAMGAVSALHVVSVPGFNRGHWVMWWPPLWEDAVSGYIRRIESRP